MSKPSRVFSLSLWLMCFIASTQFFEWARKVTSCLEGQGYWADYIDPCSGLPVRCYPASQVTIGYNQCLGTFSQRFG